MSARQTIWRVGGMHCPKCESAVVKAVSALPGIREAQSDWRRGTLTALWDSDVTSKDALVASVAEAGYALETQSGNRIFRTVAVLLAAVLLFVILELTPLRAMLSAFPTARAGMGFATLFALGLTTSLHCVGMCGGINLAQSAGAAQAGRKVGLSNLQYNLGRVLSYTVIGGIVGALGSVIRLSNAIQASIQIVAAVLMGLMALKLLDAGGLSLAMSGKLRSRLMGKGKRSFLWIGLVNGLMPCGPLQAMQLYSLSTGSWWMGALSMLMFSLGTVPLMLGFGLISGRLNRRFAKPMRIISGALVLVMAVAMLTNGLALSGVRLRVGGIGSSDHAEIAPEIQIVNSELDYRSYPDITVRAGIPVRWTIHAEADRITGCNNEMVIPQEFARVLCEAEAGRIASIERHVAGKRYVRRFVPGNRLILLGGGHIAVPLCTMASLLDFSVTVVDDRPSFANSSRFPMAAHVICNDFTSAIRELNIRPTDYICIITRGHRWDGDCLRAILPGIMPSYLGMIGSRRRVTGLLTLLAEEGFDEAWLNMIHTPIGLKIGAETPAEIAVSICAEMIQHRRSHSIEESDEVLDRTDTDFAMLHFLAEAHGPAALMMVISTHDSTPVESGTIMAMERIGRSFGTLGGGCGEAEVMRVAREMIGTGGSQVVEIEMSNDIAGEEGMVCGGSMRVLVEDIEP